MTDEAALRPFRRWFWAATVYNVLWGVPIILFPAAPFALLGMETPSPLSFVQCIGMFVLVYALGYYYLAKDPIRFAPLIWIAIAGKTFGPIGFVYAASIGELPWSMGFTILTNDLVWWPAFWAFALKYARRPLL